MLKDKGLLSKEEICKAIGCTIACKPKGLPVGDCPFDDKRGCTIYQAGSMAIEAQLSALSNQPDEKLVEMVTALLVLYTREGDCPCAEHQEQRKRLSKLILSEVAPIMAARVEEAYYKGLNKQIDLKLEQARVEERRAIRTAFIKVFRASGELWFPSGDTRDIYYEEDEMEPVNEYWAKIEESLRSGEQLGGE